MLLDEPLSALDGVTRYVLGLTGDLVDAELSPVPRASVSFTTTFGPPVGLAFRQSPGGGQAGLHWIPQPYVAVCDAQGNTVADSTATVTVALAGRAGTLAGTITSNRARARPKWQSGKPTTFSQQPSTRDTGSNSGCWMA